MSLVVEFCCELELLAAKGLGNCELLPCADVGGMTGDTKMLRKITARANAWEALR